MKKLLITAAILAVISIGIAQAGPFGLFGRGCCPQTVCPPTACPPAVTRACPPAAPVKPICTKTVMVPKTIQVPKVVQVPAQEIRIPQAPLVRHIPQAPRKIVIPQPPIPQPDIIKYECVPDRIEHIPQPDIIRYQCPVGTNENRGGCPC